MSDILNSHMAHSAALWCWSLTQMIQPRGSVSRVIEHGESNRMSVQSVAIVFGPTLLRPQTESANMTVHMVFQSQIVELMLNQFQTIFSQMQEDPLGVPLVPTRTLWGLSGKTPLPWDLPKNLVEHKAHLLWNSNGCYRMPHFNQCALKKLKVEPEWNYPEPSSSLGTAALFPL